MRFLPIAEEKGGDSRTEAAEGSVIELADLVGEEEGEVCCGGPPPPKTNPYEKPGYRLQGYVRAFLRRDGMDIPLVRTELAGEDRLGTLLARIGIIRDDYRVPPGLYGAGSPGEDSPVLVTANYKLTFDAVRRELAGLDCWLLVLDTCGINVWCAAGKKTFSTDELVRQVELTRLADKGIMMIPAMGILPAMRVIAMPGAMPVAMTVFGMVVIAMFGMILVTMALGMF